MSVDPAKGKLRSGVDLSDALEKIEISLHDGEIECVMTVLGESQSFRDSFRDGPTWRDTFGDGGQWQSSFNNMRRESEHVCHPAIQEALQKVARAISQCQASAVKRASE